MTASEEKLSEQIETLETRIAFQDDLVQKLDEALVNQQRQLMELQGQLTMLIQQVQNIEHALPEVPDGPPPHY